MKPFERLRAVALPDRAAQSRHRSDHPGAVSAEAAGGRLRPIPVPRPALSQGRLGGSGLPAEPAGVPRRAHRRGRAQLRLRIVARARGVGALRLRDPRRDRAELRRHLPLECAQERAAARSCCPPRWSARRSPRCWRSPGSRSRSISTRRPSRVPGRQRSRLRHRPLLAGIACCSGLDELDYTLTQLEHIAEFERRYRESPAIPGASRGARFRGESMRFGAAGRRDRPGSDGAGRQGAARGRRGRTRPRIDRGADRCRGHRRRRRPAARRDAGDRPQRGRDPLRRRRRSGRGDACRSTSGPGAACCACARR